MHLAPRSPCLVGPQPPPLHGVSAVNKAVLGLVGGQGVQPAVFDTAAASLNRHFLNRLARFKSVIRAATGVNLYLKRAQRPVVYLSVSGGVGALTEWPIIWLARQRGAKIILHHHSFSYLDKGTHLMKRLIRVAGPGATHILLGENMEKAIRAHYPDVKDTLILSNAAFFDAEAPSDMIPRTPCRVIGHLSNLSEEKGVFEILELARRAERNRLDFEFRVAGPFENASVENKFMAEARGLKNLVVQGPLYGDGKRRFFAEIDAFVFPTRYRNEAEPIVLLEALSYGCPVISYDRGCIASLIDGECGAVAPGDSDFLPFASQILRQWRSNPDAHAKRRLAARQKFARLHESAILSRQKLIGLLCGK